MKLIKVQKKSNYCVNLDLLDNNVLNTSKSLVISQRLGINNFKKLSSNETNGTKAKHELQFLHQQQSTGLMSYTSNEDSPFTNTLDKLKSYTADFTKCDKEASCVTIRESYSDDRTPSFKLTSNFSDMTSRDSLTDPDLYKINSSKSIYKLSLPKMVIMDYKKPASATVNSKKEIKLVLKNFEELSHISLNASDSKEVEINLSSNRLIEGKLQSGR